MRRALTIAAFLAASATGAPGASDFPSSRNDQDVVDVSRRDPLPMVRFAVVRQDDDRVVTLGMGALTADEVETHDGTFHVGDGLMILALQDTVAWQYLKQLRGRHVTLRITVDR